MIKSVTITNYLGDAITMSLREPNKTGFLISSIDGLGPVKANINTTEMATRDGSIFNSSRAESRNIIMTIVFVDSEQRETIEGLRHKTYKYFPLKKNLTMEIETDTRRLRTIGYVESNEPEIFSSQEGTQISIICPDPYFYSYGEDGTTVTVFNGVTAEFEFPFSNEILEGEEPDAPHIEFGSIDQSTEGVIVYSGDAEVGVIITINLFGYVGDITIYDITTRESITIKNSRITTITGGPMQAGDEIIINTMKGKKGAFLIRNGTGYNIITAIDRNSTWFYLVKGDNLFAYTATSGLGYIELRIENQTLFEGA